MSRSLRVLMTADAVGGVWTYACELIDALAPYDVHVTLATMGSPPTLAQVREIAALGNANLVTSSYALEWMPDPWDDVDAAGEWLLEIASKDRFDLVHLNGYSHAVLPFGVPVLVAVHSCVATWYRAVRGIDAPEEWNIYRQRVRDGLRAATWIAGPTRTIVNDVLAAHDVCAPARIIPNGRDASRWQPGTKEPFVLAAGRMWDEAKGLADLVACAPRISWPICIAGATDNPGGSRANKATQPRPVAANAHLLGKLTPESLAHWMGRASIYALPARYEPFGLSLLEAALAGASLVVGRTPSLEETWGDDAEYVTPGDIDELAHALESLATNAALRQSRARAARVRALELTPERMATAYRELYTDLVTPTTTATREVYT